VLKWFRDPTQQHPSSVSPSPSPCHGSVFAAFYGSVTEATAALSQSSHMLSSLFPSSNSSNHTIAGGGGEKGTTGKADPSGNPVPMKASSSAGQIEAATYTLPLSSGSNEAQLHFARMLEVMFIACNAHRDRDHKVRLRFVLVSRSYFTLPNLCVGLIICSF
jgi:hypothetical protein